MTDQQPPELPPLDDTAFNRGILIGFAVLAAVLLGFFIFGALKS